MKLPMAAALLSLSALATPLNGLYAVGDLGIIDFTTTGDKVTGKLRGSSRCPFAANTTVIQGALEDGTFAGSITLCQEGSACGASRTYPFLAVSHGSSFAGHVKLDVGCRSPALREKLLVLRPATDDEVHRATRKLSKDEAARLASDLLKASDILMEAGNYEVARGKLLEALELDDSRWEAYNGFGVAEVHLGRPEAALSYFDKAQAVAELRKLPKRGLWQVYYNRACALAALNRTADAVEELRTAVRLPTGLEWKRILATDADLKPLRDDPGFIKLLAEVEGTKKKPR